MADLSSRSRPEPVELKAEFTFVAVPDTERAVSPMVEAIVARGCISRARATGIAAYCYQEFLERQSAVISRAFGASLASARSSERDERPFELLVLNEERLQSGVHARTKGAYVASLNLGDAAWVDTDLGVSRLFSMCGNSKLGTTHRPGYPNFEEQVKEFRRRTRERNLGEVVLVDDHAFSCATIADLIPRLRDNDIEVDRVVTESQVGDARLVTDMGVELEPVIRFHGPVGVPSPLDACDLVEFRYFLFGATGCVVQLPNGDLGRAPYMLPFSSPGGRASIPAENEISFSRETLRASLDFYRQLEDLSGVSLLLRDVEPSVAKAVHVVHGVPMDTPVTSVITWALQHTEQAWSAAKEIEQRQVKYVNPSFPRRMVLIDVNDTLIPDGASAIQQDAIASLRRSVMRLQRAGIAVGLCSDSPEVVLRDLARELNMAGPILAENGNRIVMEGVKNVHVRDFQRRSEVVDLISETAKSLGFTQVGDVIAIEFGGTPPDVRRGEWAFGAGRESSISVFGPPALVDALVGLDLPSLSDQPLSEDATRDYTESYGVYLLHPCDDYRTGKRDTITALSSLGYSVLMVGNSGSDWVDPRSGAMCAFVSNARISDVERSQAVYVATKPHALGVAEILDRIDVSP